MICSCEIDIEYLGSSLHDQTILKNDSKSCQLHCQLNYPAASHFTYHTSNSAWTDGRLTCWCMTSNVTSGYKSGVVSGTINCEDTTNVKSGVVSGTINFEDTTNVGIRDLCCNSISRKRRGEFVNSDLYEARDNKLRDTIFSKSTHH